MGSSLSKARDEAPEQLVGDTKVPQYLRSWKTVMTTLSIFQLSSKPMFPRNTYSSTAASLLSPSITTAKPASHFRFLNLPTEIRVMIYEELLVVGKVFYTPDSYDVWNGERCRRHELFRKPELQLLRLCKQIHYEAEPVYLAKNLFVMPIEFRVCVPFVEPKSYQGNGQDHSDDRHLFSTLGFTYIKSISINIDKSLSQRVSLSFEGWRDHERVSLRRPFTQLTPQQAYEYIHNVELSLVRENWQGTISRLDMFLERLEYLEMDFTNAFCATGCCRPIGLAVGHWLHSFVPKRFDVVGLLSIEEKRQFISTARDVGNISHSEFRREYGLHFRKEGDTTPWEKWMKEGRNRA
jgi:hypothetical protein